MIQRLKFSRALTICACLGFLYGCGEDIEVTSFSIQGTTPEINGVNQVGHNDPFTVEWEVNINSGKLFNFKNNSNGYSVELYLSENDKLSTSDDEKVYDEVCGESDSPKECEDNETGAVSCQFSSNDETIECDGDNSTPSHDMLDALISRKGAFMILRVCIQDDQDKCDEASDSIKLN